MEREGNGERNKKNSFKIETKTSTGVDNVARQRFYKSYRKKISQYLTFQINIHFMKVISRLILQNQN